MRAAISSWASIPCCGTRRVSFWQPISTKSIGKRTWRPCGKRAAAWVCQRRWNGRDPAAEGISGCSSLGRCPPLWPAGSARTFLRKRWRAGRTSDWIPTTVSFRTRTRCPKAGSAISSRCPCKSRPATAATAYFSMTASRPIPINGLFCRASASWTVLPLSESCAMPSGGDRLSASAWHCRTMKKLNRGPPCRRDKAASCRLLGRRRSL